MRISKNKRDITSFSCLIYWGKGKPIWFALSPFIKSYTEKSLIPDILRRYKYNLLILDAKYRNFEYKRNLDFINKKLDIKLIGNPGVEEVLKQIAYKLVFEKNKSDISIEKLYNIFLFPRLLTDDKVLYIIGGVNLDFIENIENEYVVNVYVSASKAIEMYINKSRISDNDINEFVVMLENFDKSYSNKYKMKP